MVSHNGGEEVHMIDGKQEALMHSMARRYRRGLIAKQLFQGGNLHEQEFDYRDMEASNVMDMTLQLLNPKEAQLLRNDYLCIMAADWWKQLYSWSEYLNLKRNALDAFLRCVCA